MPSQRRRPGEPPQRRPRVAGQRRGPRPASTAPEGESSAGAPAAAPQAGSSAAAAGKPNRAGAAPSGPEGRRRLRRPGGRERPAHEGGDDPGEAGAAGRGQWLRSLRVPPLVPGLLALVAVAAAVALVVFGLRLLDQRSTEEARQEALGVASSSAVKILSYDASRLDEDFASAREVITGDFAEEYAQTTQDAVRPVATETEAVVVAEVAAVGVVSASPDEVVVLAFVNQTTTKNDLPAPRVDQNRVQLTLVPADGTWKVSGVQAL